MKLLTAVLVLGFAACLSGCEAMTEGIKSSVTHAGGGIMESDVSADLFRQHIGSATNQVVIIDYSLLTARDTFRRNTRSGLKEVTQYTLDIPGGQRDAFSMLQEVLASDYFSKPGITNTMAVLLCSGEASKSPCKVYKLDREGLPIYVVSSESVVGGAVQDNVLSSNILAFASAQASNRLFPFELPKNYKYEFQLEDPINEYRAYKKDQRGLFDGWRSMEEANEYLRKAFPQMVAVSWPRLLFPAGEESDVLLISWRNLQGRPKSTGPIASPMGKILGDWVNTPIGRYSDVPTSTPLNWCSRISGKDGVVYYYKTVRPKYQANVQDELTKMNAKYQHVATTQQ